jgi:hypothetical protein
MDLSQKNGADGAIEGYDAPRAATVSRARRSGERMLHSGASSEKQSQRQAGKQHRADHMVELEKRQALDAVIDIKRKYLP